MRIYFIRHGESVDDIEDRYGGWADYPLTTKGLKQAKETGERLKTKGVSAEVVLTSPLLRAKQTAQEVGRVLGLEVEDSQYLKERNTYGLLSGLNKDKAKRKYPELVKAYEAGQPVDGYEPYDAFLQRVEKLIQALSAPGHKNIICVTHGKVLKCLFKDFLDENVKKFGDGCIGEIEIKSENNLKIISSEGIVFE